MSKAKSGAVAGGTKPAGKSKAPAGAAAPVATAAAAAAAVPAAAAGGAVGEAAFGRLRARLLALPAAQVVTPRYNVRLGVTAALGLVDELQGSELLARLAKLAAIGEFDRAALDSLGELAHATWYIRHRLDQETALGSEARLPAALADAAQQLRGKMLRLLDFHFADDPAVAAELGYLRRGSGYQDLADDLTGLAKLYEQHRATLVSTPLHYQPADVAEAHRLAAQILAELGKSGSAAPSDWLDLSQRSAALLAAAYDEVAAAARYLGRHQPDIDSRYPRLAAVARRRNPAPAKPPEPTPAPTE